MYLLIISIVVIRSFTSPLALVHSTDTVRAIRALDHSIFLERAQTMYKAFLASIEGIQSQNTAILEIVDLLLLPARSSNNQPWPFDQFC